MDTFREWYSYSWDRLKCQMWSARIWSRDTFIHSATHSTEGSNLHQQPPYMQSDYPMVQADTNWSQREIITGIAMTLCLNKYTCPSIYLRAHKNRNWFNMAWDKLFPTACPMCSSAGEVCTQSISGRPQAPRTAKHNAWSSSAIDRENQAASEDSSEKLAS